MLKNISNLKGAQKLTNNEQKAINGGKPPRQCEDFSYLGDGVYPASPSACGPGFPVFTPNVYGPGNGTCCNY